jgi:hypothetical protein
MKAVLQNKRLYEFIATSILLLVCFTPLNFAQGSGKALLFTGASSETYVDCGNNASLQITGSLTLEAWVYISNPTGRTNSILKKYGTDNSTVGYELYTAASHPGILTFRIRNGGNYTLYSTTTISANTWTYVAATYDVTSQVMTVYINGVPDGTLAGPTALTDSPSDFAIGTELPVTTTKVFDGRMDEVRVWNVARNAAQIQADMCKKLTGSESGLVGYWNFDNITYPNCPDLTSNGNTGVMTNMASANIVTSGAAIGDASTYNYTSPSAVSLASTYDAGLTINNISGAPSGIQIYRVDSAPNVTTPPDSLNQLSRVEYFGVFIVGGTSPTYDATYFYSGHPYITEETKLRLASRTNNAATSWAMEYNFYPNTTSHSIKLTNQTAVTNEIILGTTTLVDPLPVQISSFTANVNGKDVVLSWKTETEVNNFGFNVERKALNRAQKDNGTWEKIAFIHGHNNSNSSHDYSFTDINANSGNKFVYRLKQIDNDGKFSYSNSVEVTLTPDKFSLLQNYPNPFNPTTTIKYNVPQESYVTIKIYDVLGNEVQTLVSSRQTSGTYEVNFNANRLASGIYFYRMQADVVASKSTTGNAGKNFVVIKKMLLIK